MGTYSAHLIVWKSLEPTKDLIQVVVNQQLPVGGPPSMPTLTSAAPSGFQEGLGIFCLAWSILGSKVGEQTKMRGRCQGCSGDPKRSLGNCTQIVTWEL